MSTAGEAGPSSLQEVSEEIEDYTTTILALLSLVSVLTWSRETREQLANTSYSLGRRMDTSPKDGSPPHTVTPDVVVQRGDHLGFVGEAKKSLPQCQKHWRREVEQLQKYSEDLIGWWTNTEGVLVQCTILLLEVSFTAGFAKYIEVLHVEEALAFRNSVAIVEFVHKSAAKQFIFLRRCWGEIKDLSVTRALEDGCNVPIEDVLATYGPRKFYDSKPVTEHTMLVLWQDLFNAMRSSVPFDEDEGAYPLNVNVTDLTSELQRLYGSIGDEPREVSVPRKPWVRQAMEAFVSLGLAKPGQERDEYTVLFKRLQGDLLSRFVRHRQCIGKRHAPQATQLPLFDLDVEDEGPD